MVFPIQEKFSLSEKFLDQFKRKQPKWGPLGHITFSRTYARLIPGTKRTEEFWETLKRVVEGCYTIQLNHCRKYRLPWNALKAQHSAQTMFKLMWDFKFLPPGRGLWMMGTDYIYQRGSAPLQNCSFVSTQDLKEEGSDPFTFLMDMSMLGVGVAFDTKGAGQIGIVQPSVHSDWVYMPEDSKEGWVDTCRIILDAYFGKGALPNKIDYSRIRPEGAPIKTFGGIAPGPKPLMQAEQDLCTYLSEEAQKNTKITSTCIVDIMNILGKCVVSGGIRRCLPAGTRIHTSRGLVKIEDVQVGDQVNTSSGLHKVKEVVSQGRQKIMTVHTQIGDVRCTPDHRLKVFTGLDEYAFKEAKDLEKGDKLVFLNNSLRLGEIIPLKKVELYKTHLRNTIEIPPFTEALAWLVGFFLADGYTDGYKVHFTTHIDETPVLDKAACILTYFGADPKFAVLPCNANRIIVFGVEIAQFFKQFKNAHSKFRVPEEIMRAPNELKAAFLAGVFDGDGSAKNHPIKAVTTTRPNFAKDIQSLWAAIGVPTRLTSLRLPGGYRSDVTISGKHPLSLAHQYLTTYSMKYNGSSEFKDSHLDYSYPVDWVRKKLSTEDLKKIRSSKRKTVTAYTTGKLLNEMPKTTPIDVLSIDLENLIEEDTWDLSIADNHEFVINQGIISHNTAELALGSGHDEEYITLKDPTKNSGRLKEWRWASNNSITADVGMDYEALAKQTAANGEPGYVWLENCQHYGRLKDGYGDYDLRASGVNPCGEQTLESYELCVSGHTWLTHSKGAGYISSFLGKTIDIWNGKEWSTVEPKLTSHGEKLFRVHISDGSVLEATPDHKWLVETPTGEPAEVRTKELRIGDKLVYTYPSAPPDEPWTIVDKYAEQKGREFARRFKELLTLPPETFTWNRRTAQRFLSGYLGEYLTERYRYRSINTYIKEGGVFYDTYSRALALQRLCRKNGLFMTMYYLGNGTTMCYIQKGDMRHRQYVQSVSEMAGYHKTYNLTEPKRHCCLFEMVLTKQCNLIETFPSKHETFEEYQKTLKFAYLYGKTVTLVPTHNERTNQIIWRNRRIGLSQSGIIEAFQKQGRREHFRWCDEGYKTVQHYDTLYSEWLGIPKSIKTTTVKPSGTISLLPGVTPGIHYPHSKYYFRTIRIDKTSLLLPLLEKSGFRMEESVYGDNTVVVYFPVKENNFDRSKNQVSIWEQLENAAQMQYYWADNQISITVTFDPETEINDIAKALELYETRLKVVSFLPRRDAVYEQAPYQEITEEEYLDAVKHLKRLNLRSLDTHEVEEKFCTGEACLLQLLPGGERGKDA